MRWFDHRRGFAVGLVTAGEGIGGTIWPPVFRYFNETVGWRETFLWFGVFVLVTALPASAVLWRRLPARDAGSRGRGRAHRRPAGRDAGGPRAGNQVVDVGDADRHLPGHRRMLHLHGDAGRAPRRARERSRPRHRTSGGNARNRIARFHHQPARGRCLRGRPLRRPRGVAGVLRFADGGDAALRSGGRHARALHRPRSCSGSATGASTSATRYSSASTCRGPMPVGDWA